ncbi:dihydrodipicolinate synthase family protein [Paludisphaera mucosa]|uniref:Dihydrodipicolinate synthase family protein n=1 Tax=Paludisphaera mucosa TaxID=3030827 RepID=A0ABT6F816_9BACT|nr:dihydrodipicolinate synthase family protein [Paludisphaera mucosa]MDG3003728.1 dihydrodipicolinate synthase family protein [Paludisphaera mucosa]
MPGPLTGLIPAPHTPFRTDGGLNLEVVDLQSELLREVGVTTVFVGGTTGEWASMTLAERKAVTERWCRTAGGSFQVAAHIGANCQSDAIELARHARDAGAVAVAAMSPSFFKPATTRDLVEFCAPIASEAEPLPFYYYDIPGMTNVRQAMSEFLHEARFRIPTLRGLKFSHTDIVELQECVRLDGGRFDVLFGSDEGHLAGLALGVRGAVGNTFNFAAPVYRRIEAAFARNDLETARREQGKAIDMVKALQAFGFMPASKAVMAMLGVDCGPVRSPLRTLDRSEKLALWERLSAIDVFARPLRKPE